MYRCSKVCLPISAKPGWMAIGISSPDSISQNSDRIYMLFSRSLSPPGGAAMDYGLDMLAAYWIAVDHFGRAFVYRELYEPDLIISQAAQHILHRNGGESLEAWYAPPDLWNRRQDTGRSVADIFAESGIPLAKAQNNRVQGWLDLKEWLKPVRDESGSESAALRFFSCCPNLIKSIPALQVSSKNPSDCATEPHEFTHAPDAIRYFVAGRPLPAAVPLEPVQNGSAPFENQIQDFLQFGG